MPRVPPIPGEKGFTIADRTNRPLLRFNTARYALTRRQWEWGDKKQVPADGDGFNISMRWSQRQATTIQANRAVSTAINRAVRLAADRAIKQLRVISRPTYDTGAFYSNWKYSLENDDGGVQTRIAFRNMVPYAKYIHRSGDPRNKTVINAYILPYLHGVFAKTLAAEVRAVLPKAVKDELFGGGS